MNAASADGRRGGAHRERRRAGGRVSVLLGVACLLGLLTPSAGAVVVVPDGGVAINGSTDDIRRGIDIAHAAGVRWVSLSATWEALEPAPDDYGPPGGSTNVVWGDLLDRLSYAKSRGMNVELRFSNAPGWASGVEGRTDDPPTPGHAQDYGAFLGDVATRLGPYIDAYSPWNEPNISNFWNPVDPEAYTAVQKIAYAAIKAKDPSATVLSATIVGTYPNAYGYLRRAYAAGLKGSADVIGWNAYPNGEPENAYRDVNGLPAGSSLPGQLYLRDLIDEFDPGRKVWIMELSWSNCIPCTGFPANGATEAQQADYLSRTFAYRRRYLTDVTERIFWFALRDGGTEPHNWEHHQGLLRRDFSPKPSLAALTGVGIDSPSGALPGVSTVDTPVGGGSTPVGLPAAASRVTLPTVARSRSGRVALGKPVLLGRRGRLTLTVRVSVSGGATRVRIQGYRGRVWRPITKVTLRRSGRLTLSFPDKAYLGVRVLASVPGRPKAQVGRIVPVAVARAGVPGRTR